MSETKKKEYTRETCTAAAKEVLQHALEINEGKADYQYYNKVKELILFGSYVNSDKPSLHDLDVCFISDDDRVQMLRFYSEHPELQRKFRDSVTAYFAEYYLRVSYLKGNRKMISIHSNVEEGDQIRDIATSGKHLVLISDYRLTEDGRRLLEA